MTADHEHKPKSVAADDDEAEAEAPLDDAQRAHRNRVREQHHGWYERQLRARALPPEERAARHARLVAFIASQNGGRRGGPNASGGEGSQR